jgi:acetylglutamate kinase
MDKIYIIKIGGNIIDEEGKLAAFLKDFASVEGKKILVHGGGKLATRMAEQLQLPQQMVDGRRVTDAETLKIVTMVYAGFINKNIVAQLAAYGCIAFGLCGADGNAILAHKRKGAAIDYGFVGDVDKVNVSFLNHLFQQTDTLVMAPITHDGAGTLLNTNADTIAQELAKALSSYYHTSLIYSFEKAGVLENADDETTVISHINALVYKKLREEQVIFAGMIPKLDNAFAALHHGVAKVVIGKAEFIHQLIDGTSGTTIAHE